MSELLSSLFHVPFPSSQVQTGVCKMSFCLWLVTWTAGLSWTMRKLFQCWAGELCACCQGPVLPEDMEGMEKLPVQSELESSVDPDSKTGVPQVVIFCGPSGIEQLG